MPSEEIIEGLKIAISKGETLRQAMMSFYNAGYQKEEIERAARIIYEAQKAEIKQNQQMGNQPTSQTTTKKKIGYTNQKVSSYGVTPDEKMIQHKQDSRSEVKEQVKEDNSQSTKKVSEYSKNSTRPKRPVALILIIILLLIIAGVLTGFFMFKQEAINFFSNLF